MSTTRWGVLSCAIGVGALVFPLVVCVSLVAAHLSWWRWTSGRDEKGFWWAFSAMFLSHAIFGVGHVVYTAMLTNFMGGIFALLHVLMFFMAVGLVLQSKAAKYFAVGGVLLGMFLTLICCGVQQEVQAARNTHCLWNIRMFGIGMLYPVDEYDRHPDSLAARREQAKAPEDDYSWIVRVLPYLESALEEAESPHDPQRDPFSDEKSSTAP